MWRLLALVLLFLSSLSGANAETSLIVPFHNISESPSLDWIGESISETIREALVSYDVLVLTREEREEAAHLLSLGPAARPTKASVMKLGTELDAGQVVHGEFEWTPEDGSSSPSKGLLRITAHVVDLNRLVRGPDLVEDGAMSDLAEMQTRLAWKTFQYLLPDKCPEEKEFFASRPPVRIDAMENYIRGLLAPALEQRHRFFTQAVRLDPEFSAPCFQLGRMRWEGNSYRVASQWLERVSPDDAHYLEANFLLGICRYRRGDYAGALAAFDLVAESVPLNEVRNNLGAAQFRRRLPGALGNLLRALDGDPGDSDYHFNVGYVLWNQGDLPAAQERFRAALEIDPEDADAQQMLQRCLNESGPRRGDLSSEGLERLKENYEEVAYRQLRADFEAEGQ
jgi:tetratricopeptide (TPR) repeat protein